MDSGNLLPIHHKAKEKDNKPILHERKLNPTAWPYAGLWMGHHLSLMNHHRSKDLCLPRLCEARRGPPSTRWGEGSSRSSTHQPVPHSTYVRFSSRMELRMNAGFRAREMGMRS